MFLIPENAWEIRETKQKGKGIFATKDLEPGIVLGDYLGMILHENEEAKFKEDEHFYIMYYNDDAVVYPDLTKPGIHLLNHSCTPNSWMHTYKGRTLYFTLRKIFKGEELTVSYLFSPQDDECKPCKDLCECGQILCTGTMHLPEDRYNEWAEFDTVEAKKTEVEFLPIGGKLEFLPSYPKSIPDNPIYTLFGTPDHASHTMDLKKLPSMKEIRKTIRETGQTLAFPSMNLKIHGVLDKKLISEVLKS